MIFSRDLPTTCNHGYVHDFIKIQIEQVTNLGHEFAELYQKGHSINEIARRFDLSYSLTRTLLVRLGTQLRPKKSIRFGSSLNDTYKSSSPPPYGFCYLDGKLHKDPREYPVLQIIEKQLSQGKSQTEIAQFLSSKKLKTRSGKNWRQNHIFNIVNRLKINRK